MKWKPLASGILALIILEVLVSTPAGPISSLFAVPASLASKLIDPTIPLIGHKPAAAGAAVAGSYTVAPDAPGGPTSTPSGPDVAPAQNLLLKGVTP